MLFILMTVLIETIGGVLGECGPRVPFIATEAIAFANVLYGFFVLPEACLGNPAAPTNFPAPHSSLLRF